MLLGMTLGIPGPCIRCGKDTETVLGLADPWQWQTSALMVLIGEHIVRGDLHEFASKQARLGGDAVEVCRDGIKVRICEDCVDHAESDYFPAPVTPGEEITFVKAPEGAAVGNWLLV